MLKIGNREFAEGADIVSHQSQNIATSASSSLVALTISVSDSCPYVLDFSNSEFVESMTKLPMLVLAVVLCAGPVAAEVLLGRVVGVSDGDTITVLDDQRQAHKIRVAGIDAPEKAQPFGQRSKVNLSSLVFNRDVEVVGNKRDRYGRTVAKILVAESGCTAPDCPKIIDAGLMQVMAGLAWWYRAYAKDQSPQDRLRYEAAEADARQWQVGLWQDSGPTPPWEWRHRKR
jgi:endonuclease YncB( thermonuclease family)